MIYRPRLLHVKLQITLLGFVHLSEHFLQFDPLANSGQLTDLFPPMAISWQVSIEKEVDFWGFGTTMLKLQRCG
jgi:hypothetical protein